jgi:dihydropteroate synthase
MALFASGPGQGTHGYVRRAEDFPRLQPPFRLLSALAGPTLKSVRNPQTDRPLVMGVLNVTPDSFSDGGCYLTTNAAVAHGMELVAQGADIVDVGGESTRPGAAQVPEDVELERVLPVIEALSGHVRVSIDTVKAEVAKAALEAGATLVNDVSASLYEVAAAGGAGWVAMHMQGTPESMQASPHYQDVVSEVEGFLLERAQRAMAAGVQEVWIDPGIGFGKTMDHNLSLLHHLPELVTAAAAAGCAGVVVGTSRKRFLGLLSSGTDEPSGVDDRLEASLATAALALVAGVSMVRVHDVSVTVQAARLYGPAA